MEIGDEDSIEKISKRTVKVTKKHNDDCKRLLRLMGVPVVEAPGEAEAQCAALCENHQVYAVASEDMDSLTFGAQRFLRHLTGLYRQNFMICIPGFIVCIVSNSLVVYVTLFFSASCFEDLGVGEVPSVDGDGHYSNCLLRSCGLST